MQSGFGFGPHPVVTRSSGFLTSISPAMFIMRSAWCTKDFAALDASTCHSRGLLCASQGRPSLLWNIPSTPGNWLGRAGNEHGRKTGPSVQPWLPVRSHQKGGWSQAPYPGHFLPHLTLLPPEGLFPIFVNQLHSFLSNRKAPDPTGKEWLSLLRLHEGAAGSGAGLWHVSSWAPSATSAGLQGTGGWQKA